jgi:glucose-1-phosphate thymidylyltransferase
VAELDETGRIVSYIEKPAHPTTNLVGISLYALRREHIPLIGEYLRRPELNQDAPGYFIQWLCQQVPVYGFVFEGLWFDIGTHESLREAEEAFRGRSWLSKEGSS